jgi:RNA polymerase sigma-70 factor (ECF subfamily)
MKPGVESSLLLLERARAGDEAALADLLGRYLPRLRKWATGRLPASARHLLDTEDIVQDTLVKALRNLGRAEIHDYGALQAYLRQSLTNRLTDLYRRTRPQDTTAGSNLPAREASPLDIVIGEETLRRYECGLSRLKDEDRQAVILRVELCYDYDQIAEMLGKSSAAAARVAVSRALARLSREMRR